MLIQKFPPVIKALPAPPPWKQDSNAHLLSAWSNVRLKNDDKAPNSTQHNKLGPSSPWFISQHRDRCIQLAYEECIFEPGDIVICKEAGNKYGDLYVIEIFENYTRYPKDLTWPKHDRPFIIKCGYQNESGQSRVVYCTNDVIRLKG